tara:strand:+ start:2555 stop:5026 length:2472 start_codon:yes stop_codon:yes gene_type:complete
MTLQEFLNSCGKENCTNASLPPNPGRWCIPEDKYDTFLQLYTEAFEKGDSLYMTEIHKELSPVLIDIDFKFPIDIGIERKYTSFLIETFIKFYNEILSVCFENPRLLAFVFEKSKPVRQDGYIKDGLHIVYPYIVSEPDIQYHIRKLVLKKLEDSKLFDDLKTLTKNEDILDEAVIKNSGWFLYGSTKQNSEYYKLSYILDDTLQKTELIYSNLELITLLSIRNKTEKTNVIVDLNQQEISNTLPVLCETDHIEIAKVLTKMLSKERSDNYTSWIHVGYCLSSISYSLLDVFIEFSKGSSKYKDGEPEKKWKSFKQRDGPKLTIASLNLWAKVDSPSEYQKHKKMLTSKTLNNNIDCTHFGTAKLMFIKYGSQFICASLSKDIWWEFSNHRWNQIDKASELRSLISTEIADDYFELIHELNNKALENPDEAKEKVEIRKKVLKAISLTQNRGFKDQVIKECGDLFKRTNFENNLDSNLNLLGFENGVFDLNEMNFRDGYPDDMVTMSTGIEYSDEMFDQKNENAKELLEFIEKVLPDKDVRVYVLKLLASFLCGKTGEQKFHIWTGSGSNGKSKLLDLVEYAFNDYSIKLPVTVLTHKRGSSSAANPEIAKTMGKRFLTFQEPEKEDRIHVGYMKELSGGDTITARPLYREPFEFKPQFHMILACNDLPNIPSDDGGTWRRIRVVDFPSKFVDEPNPLKPNEFKKDIDIPEKLKGWTKPFMGILLSMYDLYKKQGLKEPEPVMRFTRSYQRKSNFFLEFIDEKLETVDDKKEILTISSVYIVYKQWHQDNFGEKAPTRNTVKEQMEKVYGSQKTGWKGIKIKN